MFWYAVFACACLAGTYYGAGWPGVALLLAYWLGSFLWSAHEAEARRREFNRLLPH